MKFSFKELWKSNLKTIESNLESTAQLMQKSIKKIKTCSKKLRGWKL